MKRACAFLVAILMAAVLFAACASEEPAPTPTPVPTATPTPEPEEPAIAAVMDGGGAFSQAFAAALEPQITAAGYRLLAFFPDTAADQENDIYSAIGQGAECIIIQPVDMDSLQLVMEECYAQAIPVINAMVLINGFAETLICPDYREMGALAAQAAGKTGAETLVLMVEGNYSTYETQLMYDGFEAAAAELDAVSLKGSVLVDEEAMDTYDKVAAGLAEYPDANLLFVTGEELTGDAVRAARESGRAITVIAVGGSADTMQKIAEGSVFASVLASPVQLAQLAGEYALNAVGARAGEIPPYAELKPEVIDQTNVAEYQAKGGYADILVPPTPTPAAAPTPGETGGPEAEESPEAETQPEE